MQAAYLSTAYLAPVQYYQKLSAFDKIFLETAENYPKQTYRNRCHIASANGMQVLTVPIEKPAAIKTPTRDIRISNHGNWRHIHWNAFVSAYNLSPFFEYYADDFRPFYEKKTSFLIDFNEAIQIMICGLLDINPTVIRTTQYTPYIENDFRCTIDPRHPVSDEQFIPRPYYQVFRDKYSFIPNLSIVDLLFNMGPEACLLIEPIGNRRVY